MVYGDLEHITAIHGEILPVPSDNVIPVRDAEIDIGSGVSLKIIDAPGHAPHHLSVFEPESGCLFAGEALGHFYPESGVVNPAIAPPSFDYAATKNTIKALKRIQPRIVCFSQFGCTANAGHVFEESTLQLDACWDFVIKRLEEKIPAEKIIDDLSLHFSQNRGAADTPVREMFASIVVGFQTYFQRTGQITPPA
jgi:glyoxylase-like metal-dependent hydrolase (beta-lactamase superfamily II)